MYHKSAMLRHLVWADIAMCAQYTIFTSSLLLVRHKPKRQNLQSSKFLYVVMKSFSDLWRRIMTHPTDSPAKAAMVGMLKYRVHGSALKSFPQLVKAIPSLLFLLEDSSTPFWFANALTDSPPLNWLSALCWCPPIKDVDSSLSCKQITSCPVLKQDLR